MAGAAPPGIRHDVTHSYRATLPADLAAEPRARRKPLGLTYTIAAGRAESDVGPSLTLRPGHATCHSLSRPQATLSSQRVLL
jgi:hypothetical protein